MTLNELFLIAIGATLAINIAVVASAPHRAGLPWKRPGFAKRWVRMPADVRSLGVNPIPPPEPNSRGVVNHGAGTAAAIEAFVSGVDRGADGGEPTRGLSPPSELGAALASSRQAGETEIDDVGPAVAVDAESDTWNRQLREETARVARFGRRATVVCAEYPDLELLSERLGAAASARVGAELARLLGAEGRATDRVTRLGLARFGILLVETDELAASRYVDRVRSASDNWLASAGLAVRLTFGWASPEPGTDLALAAETARERAANCEAALQSEARSGGHREDTVAT